jgi:saccharopine dehydrogenase (NAD+, L-lysine-forming)
VAVLGAAGTIAPAIVRDLAESDEVTALRLLDLDLRRAEGVAIEHGRDKAQAYAVDARENLAERLAGIDALVNSAAYRVNLAAMNACLEAGCHYLDLGGLYHVTKQQLELSGRFKQRGRLALLGIGSAPGKTNLLALRGLRELGGPVRSISIAAASRDLDPPEGLSFPYSVQTLLDELTMAPMALLGGKPKELRPLQPGPVVDFGEPIGEAETIFTLHSETLTLGDTGATDVTFALALSPRVREAVEVLLGAAPEEVEAAAKAASRPSPNTVSVHIADVHGIDAGGVAATVRARSVTPPHEAWGLGGGVVSTASPMAAAVRMLARGQITETGARPPERCIDPDVMFAELETRGVRFDVRHYTGDARSLATEGV